MFGRAGVAAVNHDHGAPRGVGRGPGAQDGLASVWLHGRDGGQ